MITFKQTYENKRLVIIPLVIEVIFYFPYSKNEFLKASKKCFLSSRSVNYNWKVFFFKDKKFALIERTCSKNFSVDKVSYKAILLLCVNNIHTTAR